LKAQQSKRGMQPNRLNDALEKAEDRSEQFVSFFKRSWRPIAGGAAALLLFSIGMLWMTLDRPFASKAKVMTVPVPTVATSTGFYRSLDGVSVADASSTNLLPLGVMVENSMDAWPLSGVAKANVVFEVPVEGSITRFFLLFDPTTVSEDIGPVRSARPYYVDFSTMFGSLYAHVGGSPEALSNISKIEGFKNLDQFFNDKYFWRSGTRYAPHNVFTSVTKLSQAADKNGWSASSFTPWTYEDIATSTNIGLDSASTTMKVPYAGAYAATWAYDAESGLYTRSQGRRIQKDADGTVVTAKNVVLLATDATVLDNVGRLRITTTGSGDAVVAHDGKIIHGTWSRKDGQNFTFNDADGKEIPFGRGKTWISIITNGGLEKVVQ
jgi:hypothetical protein